MISDSIAILGGSGMLGTEIKKRCDQKNIQAEIFDLPEFDITRPDHIEPIVDRHSLIINCAAYTNVEKAESQEELAFQVNAEAVGRLGQAVRDKNRQLIHISTDFVFDGQKDGTYSELDKPNPINAYGRSKWAGEKALTDSGCEHCVIRVEWTYGTAGNNFIKKLIEISRQRDELKVVDDQIGSPTATKEAAKAILGVAEKFPGGLFHFAAAGYVSRFEMANTVFEYLDKPIAIRPCKSSEFKTAAQRPLNSRFDCEKIYQLLDEPVRPWQEPLRGFVKEIAQQDG